MIPPARPLAPAGFSASGRAGGVAAMATFAALMLLSGSGTPVGGGDIDLRAQVTDAVRHGAGYYDAVAEAARGAGGAVPAGALPDPAAPIILSNLPGWLAYILLWSLALLVMIVWNERSKTAGRGRRLSSTILLALGVGACLHPGLASVPESWAGLLIAVALIARGPDRWVEPAAAGLAASVLTPAALPLLIVMVAAALREGARREALGWALAAGGALLVLAFHLVALENMRAGILTAASAATPGPAAFVAGAIMYGPISLLPDWLAGGLVAASLWGWAARAEVDGGRTAGVLILYALLASFIADPWLSYAGVLAAAPLFAGLGFVPGALRAAWTAAVTRPRRITVRRLVR